MFKIIVIHALLHMQFAIRHTFINGEQMTCRFYVRLWTTYRSSLIYGSSQGIRNFEQTLVLIAVGNCFHSLIPPSLRGQWWCTILTGPEERLWSGCLYQQIVKVTSLLQCEEESTWAVQRNHRSSSSGVCNSYLLLLYVYVCTSGWKSTNH